MRLALIILVVGMICIAGVSYVGIDSGEEVEGNKVYQGPVPQGCDLEHFSKTGETICEVQS